MYKIIIDYFDYNEDTGEYDTVRKSAVISGTTVDTAVTSPSVDLALNKAGRAEFTVPASHPYYSKISPMSTNVRIYEVDQNDIQTNIFWGRVSGINRGWNNAKIVTCEGALAFFNDSIQDYKKYPSKTTTLRQFVEAVIAAHNAQMGDDDTRKFELGVMELYDYSKTPPELISDKKVYRLTAYETTLDVLTEMCLNSEGGYMFARRYEEGGVISNKIDWVSRLSADINQPAQFGLNLTDLNQEFEPDELYTALWPLGADFDKFIRISPGSGDNPAEKGWYASTENGYEAASETSVQSGVAYYEKQTKPTTIYNVNQQIGQKKYIQNDDAVAKYGFICKTKRWDDISDKEKLLEKAEQWMKTERFDKLTINCDVADLSVLDNSWDPFVLGKIVKVVSPPHGISADDPIKLPISEIRYELDTGKKQVTIGTQPQVTLTRITKKGNTKEIRLPDAKYDYEDYTE